MDNKYIHNQIVNGSVRMTKAAFGLGNCDRIHGREYNVEWIDERYPEHPQLAEYYKKIYDNAFNGISMQEMIDQGIVKKNRIYEFPYHFGWNNRGVGQAYLDDPAVEYIRME